jgi:hypothetical protein
MTTAKTGATLTADGVNFVYEHNSGSMLLGLIEQIADTTGTDTDKHFYKFRAGDVEKWYTCLTGNGTSQ